MRILHHSLYAVSVVFCYIYLISHYIGLESSLSWGCQTWISRQEWSCWFSIWNDHWTLLKWTRRCRYFAVCKNVSCHFDQTLCPASEIDSDTEHWPVPSYLQGRFDIIKYTHKTTPLPVFENDIYIEPILVNNTLKNSLVEVHFNIHHHKISNYDSFTGIMIQVVILKSSFTPSPSPYKQKKVWDSPFWPKPFDATTRETVPIASMSTVPDLLPLPLLSPAKCPLHCPT